MSRRRKLSKQAPPRTLYPELGDWRGFRARRRSPRLGLLAFLACAAVAGTVVMALGGQAMRTLGQLWVVTLLALQLVIVTEARLVFRGPLRIVLPVLAAVVVPVAVAISLHASPWVVVALGVAFLALVFVPQRWLERVLGDR